MSPQQKAYISFNSFPSKAKHVTFGSIAQEFQSYYHILHNLSPSFLTICYNYFFRPWAFLYCLCRLENPLNPLFRMWNFMHWIIALAKPGKALGPDGLSTLHYKTFRDNFISYFPCAFKSKGDGSSLLTDSLGAHFTVLPKQGKVLSQCSSYRVDQLTSLTWISNNFPRILPTDWSWSSRVYSPMRNPRQHH